MVTCSPNDFTGRVAKKPQVGSSAFLRKRKSSLQANQPKFSPERMHQDNPNSLMRLPANVRHLGIYQTSAKKDATRGEAVGRTSPTLSKMSNKKSLAGTRSPSLSKLAATQPFGELKQSIEKVTPVNVARPDASFQKTLLQSPSKKSLSVH